MCIATYRLNHNSVLIIVLGSLIDIEDKDGKTPLQLAKENKHAKMVKLLKKYGMYYSQPSGPFSCQESWVFGED